MRQMSVAVLLSAGYTDKQIAAELEIAENTVGVHVTHIAKALNLEPGRNTRVLIARRLYEMAA